MKFFLTISTTVLLGYLAYVYGPGLMGQDEATPETPAWADFSETEDQAAVKASLDLIKTQVVEKQPAPQVAPAAKAPSPAKRPELRRKPRKKNSQSSHLQKAPKLQPVEDTSKEDELFNAYAPTNLPDSKRNYADPMENRWINNLSGQKVKVDFSKSKVDTSCRIGNEGCDRFANERDAKLLGVVMDTKTIQDSPLKPIKGDIKRGTYVEGKPALYVK